MTILPEPFKNNYNNLLGDQRKAVDDTGRNILISASAGTGKSFVLVNRLLKRIINRELEIDEVVVMTFTRDAAAELQVKMMKELLKNRDRTDDPEMKEYLNRQIAKLPSATISTIHSFCYDIVKKYGYILDKDPLSLGNVMDDSDAAMLEQQTLDIITNEIISRPQLVACFCERSESL
ncbi:MAG: UvrD-helicase domain-containing protein, partial [Erysipelotrichaceae bacterium]|nr:UvrD-helicase domain-containing protein [Erysipelotrichaceae bacterium]